MCLRRKLDTHGGRWWRRRARRGSTCSASGSTWPRTRSWRPSARTSRSTRAEPPRALRRRPTVRVRPRRRRARSGCSATRPTRSWRGRRLAGAAAVRAARAPDPLAALRRFGRMATAEVEAVCDLPSPRAHAELWRLAAEGRVRPMRVLTGYALGAGLASARSKPRPASRAGPAPAAPPRRRSAVACADHRGARVAARRAAPPPRRPARARTTQQKPQPMLNTSYISAGSTAPRARDQPEHRRHRQRAVDAVAHLGLQAQQVEQALAGDVGEAAHLDLRLEQLAHRAHVDHGGLEQRLAHAGPPARRRS